MGIQHHIIKKLVNHKQVFDVDINRIRGALSYSMSRIPMPNPLKKELPPHPPDAPGGVGYPPDGGKDFDDCVRQCRIINDEDNDLIWWCVIWCGQVWPN